MNTEHKCSNVPIPFRSTSVLLTGVLRSCLRYGFLVISLLFWPRGILYETTTVGCSSLCRGLFMNGVDPLSKHSPQEWLKCRCDMLICNVKKEQANSRYLHEKRCRWSNFAVDTLLGQPNQCLNPNYRYIFSPPNWEAYQFADGFLNPHNKRGEEWAQYVRNSPTHSLLAQYETVVRSSERKWNNYNALLKIVEARAALMRVEELPPPNSLVIHVRLGDVIDNARDSVRDLLVEQRYFYTEVGAEFPHLNLETDSEPIAKGWNAYVKPLSFYSDRLPCISQFKSVIIMGSAHKGGSIHRYGMQNAASDFNVYKSCQYIHALESFLKRSNITVSLRLGQPPDDDIVFGSYAAAFLSSGGGFSTVIERLHLMRNQESIFSQGRADVGNDERSRKLCFDEEEDRRNEGKKNWGFEE